MLTRLLAGIWSSLNAAAARNPRERAQAYAVRLQPQALSILEQAGRQVAAGVAVDSALEPLVTPVSGCDRHRQEPERVARPTLEAIAAQHRRVGPARVAGSEVLRDDRADAAGARPA